MIGDLCRTNRNVDVEANLDVYCDCILVYFVKLSRFLMDCEI